MKASNFEDLIKKYNPFGIKDEKGESMLFENYTHVYKHTLDVISSEFPRGYIDLALLLNKLTQQPFSVCKMFVKKKSFVRNFGSNMMFDDYVLICTPENGIFPKEKIEALFKALHTLSETQFALGHFNVAWDDYIMKKSNVVS